MGCEVIRLFVEIAPGCIPAALHADEIFFSFIDGQAIAFCLMVTVAVHGSDRTPTLVKFKEQAIHILGALQGIQRIVGSSSAQCDSVSEAISGCGNRSLAAGIGGSAYRYCSAAAPGEGQLAGIRAAGQIQCTGVVVIGPCKINDDFAGQSGAGILCHIITVSGRSFRIFRYFRSFLINTQLYRRKGGGCAGCDLGNTACFDDSGGIGRDAANAHSIHGLNSLCGIGLCRGTADVRPVGTVGRRLPLITGCSSIRRQRDLLAECCRGISGDVARGRSNRQLIGEKLHTLVDKLLHIADIVFEGFGFLISHRIRIVAVCCVIFGNVVMPQLVCFRRPTVKVHCCRISNQPALGVQIIRNAIEIGFVFVVHLIDTLHKAVVLAKKLEERCLRLIDSIDEPTAAGNLTCLAVSGNLIANTAKRSVQIPDRTGYQLVAGFHCSLGKENTAFDHVLILIEFVEQIHLCPGIQIKVIQIIVRTAVSQCVPCLTDRSLHLIHRHLVGLFFYGEPRGVRQSELILIVCVVDLHHIAIVWCLIVILRCQKIDAQVLTVHPHIDTLRGQTDA